MKRFSLWQLVLIFGFSSLLIVFALPNFTESKMLPDKKLHYGLDLRGGSQLLLKVDFKNYIKEQLHTTIDTIRKALRKEGLGYVGMNVINDKIHFQLKAIEEKDQVLKVLQKTSNDFDVHMSETGLIEISYSEAKLAQLKHSIIEQTREIIRYRIDENGTLEPSITKYGELGVLLQVPGLDDPEQLRRILGKTAQLTFNVVEGQYSADTPLPKIMPSKFKVLKGEDNSLYIIENKSVLTGNALTDAQLSNSNGQPAVSFSLNTVGSKLFAEVTKQHRGQRLAIVLDDKVISAPVINEPILTGNGIISGNFTASSANELALLLRAGSLPAPLIIAEEKIVGPSLGEDSIALGKKSALIAGIAVVSFMIATYGIYGVFASVSLVFNIIFIISILTILGASLTMPGVAGIVLTMGMAVDANVLIFERIREESRKVKAAAEYAINRGFEQAYATILDSNLTTLIAAFFLYTFGSGVVKGFAVTLTIGILSSMFTAITLTKMFIFYWMRSKKSMAPV